MSNAHMKLGPEYFRLIAHFERGPANDPRCRLTTSGAALDAYLCPADVATIGAGSIRRLDGSPVQMGDSVTEDQIFLLAERDAEDAADAVRKIERPLKQFQFEALTAFTHNLGEGNLRKIAPLIEAGRWEDAAEKMWEYVRAWGKRDGQWYYQALLGLRIRRAAEALHLLGLPWSDVCDSDNIGMPRKRVWQSDGIAKDGTRGRYFDELLPGATEFTTLEDMARASITAPAPVLTQPAPALQPAGNGAAPVPSPTLEPAHAPEKQASASGSAGAAPVKPEVNVPPPLARPAPAPVVVKPAPSAPLSLPKDAAPASIEPKDMVMSKRFWGLTVTALGTTNLLPQAAQTWVTNEGNRELITWLIVVAIGFALYKYGQHKAKKPLK